MKKNKLWFLLALLICMAVLCTAAAAADGEESTGVTALWLGSKDLKEGGYWEIGFPDLSGSSEVTSVSSDDSWNVHYDPAENTLTLRDADFTGSCMDADGLSASQSTAALFVDGDLSINIIGTNSIASNYFYGDYSYGAYIDGGNISISGQDGARLTFTGGNASSPRGVYATSTSNLTMESGTLSCVGGVGGSSRGMNWYGNITLQGTSRLVSNKGDGYGSTVYVSGLLTIENTARMDCKGIITDYGEIHIKDNGVMFSNGTISRFDSIGVEDNGEITAEAITGADEITAINYAEITGGNRESGLSYGISASKIVLRNDAKIIGMGKTRGIDGAIEAYNDAEVYGYAGGAAGYPSSMGSGISGNLKGQQ